MDYATSDPPLSPPPSPPRSAARSTIGWWRPMVPPGPPASSPNSCEERTSELGAHLILVEGRFCVHARVMRGRSAVRGRTTPPPPMASAGLRTTPARAGRGRARRRRPRGSARNAAPRPAATRSPAAPAMRRLHPVAWPPARTRRSPRRPPRARSSYRGSPTGRLVALRSGAPRLRAARHGETLPSCRSTTLRLADSAATAATSPNSRAVSIRWVMSSRACRRSPRICAATPRTCSAFERPSWSSVS